MTCPRRIVMMDSFGYAVGVALTDASVFVHTQQGIAYNSRTREVRRDEFGAVKKRSYTTYRIALQCRDEAFIKRFADAISDLAGKPVKYRTLERIFAKPTLPGIEPGYVFRGFQMLVVHKATADRLMDARERVRSLEFGDFSREQLEAMLVAFVDADGYFSPDDGNILIRQKDPGFMTATCDRLGVPYRLSSYQGQTASEIYIPKAAASSINTFKRR